MGRVSRMMKVHNGNSHKSQPHDAITEQQFKAGMREISSYLKTIENRIAAVEAKLKEVKKDGNKN